MSERELFCINHPDRPAIETCEVCHKALCGYCLYYTEDGQRLCEQHAHTAKASGLTIIPPAVYAEGIIPAQADAKRSLIDEQPKGAVIKNRPLYQGNNQDLNAFIAMGIGVLSMAAWCGGYYCLPFLAVGIGILALMNAKDAVDPRRTRQQAWIGIGTGGCLMVCILLFVGGCIFAWGSGIAFTNSSVSSGHYSLTTYPSSTAPPAPTSTSTPNIAFNIEPSGGTTTAKAQLNGITLPIPSPTP
jgi:hypothetical protein